MSRSGNGHRAQFGSSASGRGRSVSGATPPTEHQPPEQDTESRSDTAYTSEAESVTCIAAPDADDAPDEATERQYVDEEKAAQIQVPADTVRREGVPQALDA
jgi:hypothetical protein